MRHETLEGFIVGVIVGLACWLAVAPQVGLSGCLVAVLLPFVGAAFNGRQGGRK